VKGNQEIKKQLEEIPFELKRRLRIFDRGSAPYIEVDGRQMINLTSNNYLSLATDPLVIEGAVAAVKEDGAGAGSSRLIAGTSARITLLESKLAELKNTERALVTTSGFTAALSSIVALVGRSDGIVIEKSSHACLISGARLSGSKTIFFRKNNLEGLTRALKKLRDRSKRLLIILDGVHSMDGDIAPLPEILNIAEEFDSFLLVDDAHGTGTLGPNGEGIFAHFGIKPSEYVIQMGTLSKALGSQGGFLAADKAIIDLFIQKSPAFIYTTGLNPAAVGAANAALDILAKNNERVVNLRRNISAFCKKIGIQTSKTPIIPIVIGGEKETIELSNKLEAAGCLTLPIRPPTVPKGTSRLRLSVQSGHRFFVETSEHASEERYLVLLRSRTAE